MQTHFFQLPVLVCAGVVTALALAGSPVKAQSPGVNLAQLVAQVNALNSEVTSLQSTVTSQATEINNLQGVAGTQAKTITTLQNTVSSQESAITGLENQLGQFAAGIATNTADIQLLEQKTAPLSVANGIGTNTELYITGVNVHIVDGTGYTDDGVRGEIPGNVALKGLGNLIIGYNLMPGFTAPIALGSHNLILGDANDYLGFGGIVDGVFNQIGGSYSSVLGGSDNASINTCSVIVAGTDNEALANNSCVVAGADNIANGSAGEIAGGESNVIDPAGFNAAIAGSNNQEINSLNGFLP